VRLSPAEYEAPVTPPSVRRAIVTAFAQIVRTQNLMGGAGFDSAIARRRLFMLDEAWTFVNHGAFGAALAPAFNVAHAWRTFAESQPLRFFDRVLLPHMVHSVRRAAEFVGADARDLVLLPNATMGLNIVMQSMTLRPGDHVFMLDTAYGAAKSIAQHVCARTGAHLDMVPVPLPLAQDPAKASASLVQLVERHMHPDTALAVFDHCTSNTALSMPVNDLARAAKSKTSGATEVLVDGAHGLLAHHDLRLSASDMPDVDFYVANCHKWLCSPKAVALLWAPRRKPAPVVLSHGADHGFLSQHVWDGCRDHAAALSLPFLFDAWEVMDAMWGARWCGEHMHVLLRLAVAVLVDAWQPHGGGALIAPVAMHRSMALVGVPPLREDAPHTSADAKVLQDMLHDEFTVECPVKTIDGALYVRISAHIYNDVADYRALAVAVLSAVDQLRTRV